MTIRNRNEASNLPNGKTDLIDSAFHTSVDRARNTASLTFMTSLDGKESDELSTNKPDGITGCDHCDKRQVSRGSGRPFYHRTFKRCTMTIREEKGPFASLSDGLTTKSLERLGKTNEEDLLGKDLLSTVATAMSALSTHAFLCLD